MTSQQANQVVCPRCGEVRLETPPGTTVLPTLGMARKASGVAGECDCGRAPHERPGALAHRPGQPAGPGSANASPSDAADAEVAADPAGAADAAGPADPADAAAG